MRYTHTSRQQKLHSASLPLASLPAQHKSLWELTGFFGVEEWKNVSLCHGSGDKTYTLKSALARGFHQEWKIANWLNSEYVRIVEQKQILLYIIT